MAPGPNSFLSPKENHWQIPVKTSFEKEGTYINATGETQKIKKNQLLSSQALSLTEIVRVLNGESVDTKTDRPYFKNNQFLDSQEKLW